MNEELINKIKEDIQAFDMPKQDFDHRNIFYNRNYSEEAVQDYAKEILPIIISENEKMINYVKDRIQILEVSYSNKSNDEYYNAKLFGGKKELEMLLSILN